MATLFDPHFQATLGTGAPAAGALLYFYSAGTTSPLTTYADAAATTPSTTVAQSDATDAIVADSAGLFAPIYIPGTADYKFVLKKSDLTIIQTVDNIAIPSSASSSQPLDSDLTTIAAAGVAIFSGFLYGLGLTNNGSDASNDIDIAAGVAVDSTNSSFMQLSASLTKRVDAAWSVGTGNGGLDTGAVANTTYFIWLIKRTDTGVVDALFSASSSAPTMPTNYTLKRLLGSFSRVSGVNGPPFLSVPAVNAIYYSSDAGATAGPVADLYRDSQSPAASDILAQLIFNGRDSAGNKQEYASIETVITDATSASEDAAVDFYAYMAGARTRYLALGRNAANTATANAIGLPLGQLSFPATQNASSDANTLDDYEEGTFSIGMTFGGSATGVTFTNNSGIYTKIGNICHIGGILITLTSNGSGVGTALVTGLPFTQGNGSIPSPLAVVSISGFSGLTAGVSAEVTQNATTIGLRGPATTGDAAITDTNVTDTASFRLAGLYPTA